MFKDSDGPEDLGKAFADFLFKHLGAEQAYVPNQAIESSEALKVIMLQSHLYLRGYMDPLARRMLSQHVEIISRIFG